MPGRDGSGPKGLGGWCTASRMTMQAQMPMQFGRGFRGRGGRCRNMFYATGLPGWIRTGDYSPSQEEALKREEKLLEGRLEKIRQEIKDLGGKG